jgi:DHA1 family tetracycline resistance protein-like MFS transporter
MRYNETAMKRAPLWPIVLTVFIDLLGFGIVIPILAPLFIDPASPVFGPDVAYGTRTILLGVVLGAYPLAQFFGAPILGAISDRFGRKRPLIFSIAVNGLCYGLIAYGVATAQFWVIVASRVIAGLAGGNIAIAYSAIADVSDAKSKAKNFGLVGMAFGLGFIVGPFLGGKLADPTFVSWFNPTTPFVFAGLIAGLNVLAVLLVFQETLRARVHVPISLLTGLRNIRKAFGMKNVRVMFVVIFLLTFGFTCFTNFFQVYVIDRFHYDSAQIGNLFAYIGLWIAFTQGILTGPVAKRLTPGAVVRLSSFGLGASLLAMVLPMPEAGLFLVLPLVSVFQGLTQPNATAIISNFADMESQGEMLGINQSVQAFAMVLPPLIGGWLAALHPGAPIVASAVITFAAWAVYAFIFHPSVKAKKFHEV